MSKPEALPGGTTPQNGAAVASGAGDGLERRYTWRLRCSFAPSEGEATLAPGSRIARRARCAVTL